MFKFFRKNRIIKYTDKASAYLEQTFTPEALSSTPKKETITKFRSDTISRQRVPSVKDDVNSTQKQKRSIGDVRYCLKTGNSDVQYSLSDTRYSDRDTTETSIPAGDKYDSNAVAAFMNKYNSENVSATLLKDLDKTINQTFVDALILYINQKGMRDSEVYKAAQIDRRLFSKIMSNREYKPAKDTVIALALALKLSLEETNDLLSRAGYILSHSNKKDVIIEYFLRERIYKLDDINEVLFNLDQKIIGR